MTVTSILRRLISTNIRQTARKFHGSSVARDGAYEGDGKTTLSILNKDPMYGLMIDSYSEVGFRLNNGIMVLGPLAIFPKSVLSWKIGGIGEINEETLSLFSVLEPKLDVLVLGIGSEQRTPKFDKTVVEYINKHKINMEIVPTNQACAIFNFLNAEGRFVAAGLIPPRTVSYGRPDALDGAGDVRVLSEPTGL